MKTFVLFLLSFLAYSICQTSLPALIDPNTQTFNFQLTGAYPEGIEFDGDNFYVTTTGISFGTSQIFPDFGVLRIPANQANPQVETQFVDIPDNTGTGVGIELSGNQLFIATTSFPSFLNPSLPGFAFGITIANVDDGNVTDTVDFSDFPGNRGNPHIANDAVVDSDDRVWVTDTAGNFVYSFDLLNGTVLRFTSDVFAPVSPPLAIEFVGLNGIEYVPSIDSLIVGYSGLAGNAQLFIADISNITETSLNCTTDGVTAPVTRFCDVAPGTIPVVAATVDLPPSGLDGIYLDNQNTLWVVGNPTQTFYQYSPSTDYQTFTSIQVASSISPDPTTAVSDPARPGVNYAIHANFFSATVPETDFSIEAFPGEINNDTDSSSSASILSVSMILSFVLFFFF